MMMGRKQKQKNNEAHHHQEPVISPTMSSITMKSEFDLLGSTNLDGCKLVPALMMNMKVSTLSTLFFCIHVLEMHGDA